MGDTLQAVDGHALGAHDDLFALLENRIGKKTTLRIAGAGGARNVEIKPIDTHALGVLAYDGWATCTRRTCRRRRCTVSTATSMRKT